MGERTLLENVEGVREKYPIFLGTISLVGAISLSISSCLAATCEKTTFPNSAQIPFTNIKGNSEYAHVWGRENMKITEQWVVVSFPKGSFSPSNGDIKGGAWFIYAPQALAQATHTKLSYTLTFADNFNFVKWGKLPGLCGGDCPRGGNADEKWFSTRFMWRRNGALEVYGYFQGKAEQSIGRGMFYFVPWKQYEISQELKMNTPGKRDGVVKVFVDGKCVYEDTSMVFDTHSDISPNKMLFSTFFWGSDASWATPVDTSISFWNFTVEWK